MLLDSCRRSIDSQSVKTVEKKGKSMVTTVENKSRDVNSYLAPNAKIGFLSDCLRKSAHF